MVYIFFFFLISGVVLTCACIGLSNVLGVKCLIFFLSLPTLTTTTITLISLPTFYFYNYHVYMYFFIPYLLGYTFQETSLGQLKKLLLGAISLKIAS